MAVAKWLKKKRYKPTRTKGKERKETFWKLKAYGQVITDTAADQKKLKPMLTVGQPGSRLM